jgi:hypothetical protein
MPHKKVKEVRSVFTVPYADFRAMIPTLYSNDFLDAICTKTGIQNPKEKEHFCYGVRHTLTRYVELKRANPVGIQPHTQSKMLNKYRDALRATQAQYNEIRRFASTSLKLDRAIRKKFEETTEPGMREMFRPYCDGSGMAVDLFGKFIGVLADAAEAAKNEDIGHDKADFSSDLLMQWVAAMGKFWPESASVTFALGTRDKDAKIYTSRSISILHELIVRIEPKITEKKIENAMRKVSKKGLVTQHLAIFYLK